VLFNNSPQSSLYNLCTLNCKLGILTPKASLNGHLTVEGHGWGY